MWRTGLLLTTAWLVGCAATSQRELSVGEVEQAFRAVGFTDVRAQAPECPSSPNVCSAGQVWVGQPLLFDGRPMMTAVISSAELADGALDFYRRGPTKLASSLPTGWDERQYRVEGACNVAVVSYGARWADRFERIVKLLRKTCS